MDKSKQKLIVFASGSKDGGGSGFENLVEAERLKPLSYEVVAVVSNHENGGVRKRADRLGIPFIYFGGPFEKEEYRRIVKESGADWASLSGWLKLALGLDPAKTINIHPGPLPRFGGKGMYGHYVHEAVMEAYKRGEVSHSAVSMHFVTEKYDEGPLFFDFPVRIEEDDTAGTLAKRVNLAEHFWQPFITHLVVSGEISWDGKDRRTLKVPDRYPFLP